MKQNNHITTNPKAQLPQLQRLHNPNYIATIVARRDTSGKPLSYHKIVKIRPTRGKAPPSREKLKAVK